MFTREDFPVEKLGKFVKIVLHYMCEPRSPGELSISGRFTEIATYKEYIDPGLHIVGDWEAKPADKKISGSSPLGKALVGRKVGEKVEVEAPAGKVIYSIVSIE